MSKVIGIDLGTTNSCVSVYEVDKAVVIVNKDGKRTTPSVVSLADGQRVVGEAAKRQIVTNKNTVASIKSHMGTDYKVTLEDKEYTPQEVSAIILQTLKQAAEEYLGEEVTKAVITVPAYFNDSQRQATKDAGKIAGLQVERIINEPTAAALAYGLSDLGNGKTILVYDLGGGTFDVSILRIEDGVFQVLATAGNNKLGGDNFDEVIMDFLVEGFKETNGADLTQDAMAMNRIREAAEKAKIDLTSSPRTQISLPFITFGPTGPQHLEVDLNRAKFDDLTSHLVAKTSDLLKQVLTDAKLDKSQLDKVILVGGSTRIPAVVNAVKTDLGIEPDKSVNPDEVVAMGAAVQGSVLSGEINGLLLLDVNPLSIGIETSGGIMTKLIERNTTIPTAKTQVFSTSRDNQPMVDVHVLQGERPLASKNKTLTKFQLADIPPAPRGIPQIEVTFEIDADGILSVRAKDLGTGQTKEVVVESSDSLTSDEINRMIQEAESNSKQDELVKEEMEFRNESESLIFQTEKTLKDLSASISEEDNKAATEAVTGLRQALKANAPLVELKEANHQVSATIQPIVEKIYSNTNTNEEEKTGDDKFKESSIF